MPVVQDTVSACSGLAVDNPSGSDGGLDRDGGCSCGVGDDGLGNGSDGFSNGESDRGESDSIKLVSGSFSLRSSS